MANAEDAEPAAACQHPDANPFPATPEQQYRFQIIRMFFDRDDLPPIADADKAIRAMDRLFRWGWSHELPPEDSPKLRTVK